jgi:hypothetical protein
MPSSLSDASYYTHQFLEGPYARVPKEVGCALAASFLVSPLVSIIDKAIVQEIAGVTQLLRSIEGACAQMVLHPRQFFSGLSFRLTSVVYFGTYAVANCSEAALDYYKVKEEKARKTWKVSLASTANVGLLAWRDSVFVRTFTAASPPDKAGGETTAAAVRKTPLRTLGLFAARDTVTMISTFYAAPKAAEYLTVQHDVNKEVANISTALLVPVLSQFLTAPIHIHALDFYTRPQSTAQERWNMIRGELWKVCLARGLRIFPAFGIGSYSNNKFRELTIRQPNEELLLARRVSRRIHGLGDKIAHNH